jgi:hypothetical protein
MGIRARGVAFLIRSLSLLPGALPRLAPVALSVGVAAAGAVLLTDAVAEGKSAYDSPYGYERTWIAIIRLVRVDLGLKILEKDDANGYLVFEYRTTESQKASSGTFELIRGTGSAARPDDVRVLVQLAQMPRYHEQVLLNELARKMRDEYGEPPEPRAPSPPPSVADAGPDGNEENQESY